MRQLVHQLPDSDQVLGQTHVKVQMIMHNPDGKIMMRCQIGTVDGDGNFVENQNLKKPRINIPNDGRVKFDDFAVNEDTAPEVASDPLKRYENALLNFLDSEGWSTYWNL